MNRIWPVLLKSIVILALWVAVVSLSVRSVFSLVMASHLPLLILFVCGVCFVILNIVCFAHLYDSVNCAFLILLLVTQTVLMYPLCLQVWRAFAAAIEKDKIIRRQKILKARYANWVVSKPSRKQLPDIDSPHTFASCVPSRPAPASPTGATSQQGASVPGDDSPALEVTRTKFHANTKTIKLSLDTPEIYVGERRICKYVMRALKHLIFKKLSYYIITNASGDILHVSKSKAIANELPDRVVQKDPLVICNDNHYIITFVTNPWFEKVQVTKRSDGEIVTFQQVNLNKFIWPLLWPSTVALFYAMFEIQNISRRSKFQILLYPVWPIHTHIIMTNIPWVHILRF
ncbi:uncharacterized protein LOC134780062 [Penaeus indicus]|uniref:uncharacterized protein LOC134780062 n=1 Tax=Penaeus indicus TaxID=29960 RepID=UPI00300DAAA4